MVAIMSYAFGISQTMSAMIPITARMVQIMDFTSWVVYTYLPLIGLEESTTLRPPAPPRSTPS